MPNIGMQELVIIVVLALIFLGPKRLPDVARRAGRLLRDLRQATAGVREEIRAGFESSDVEDTDPNFPYIRPPDAMPSLETAPPASATEANRAAEPAPAAGAGAPAAEPSTRSSLDDAPWPSTQAPSSDAGDPRV